MIIESTSKTKIVEDYDFRSVNNHVLPVTIDPSAGDTIDMGSGTIIIRLAAQASPIDPTITLPPRTITIFTAHLLAIEQQTREIVALTPDQTAEWQRTYHEMGTKIQ